MKKRILSALLSLVLIFSIVLASAQSEPDIHKYSYMFFGTFDTAITLIAFAPSQEEFDKNAKLVEDRFNELHKQFNQYLRYEGLNNMYYLNNNAAKEPVRVPEELFQLIKWAKEEQTRTQGMVNIALGAVLALWHDERDTADLSPEQAKLPDMDKLEAANRHTNIDFVILDEQEQTIYYQDPLLKLEVGAVAKGYATELVARMLLDTDMTSFIINAGGNVRTGHLPLDGRKAWGIGIQDPDAALVLPAGDDVMDILFLSDLSLVTSGDYQRYYMVDGKRYHHLISPETLMPADHMRSVTIITEDSGYADLLSTAVFLMPYEQGRAYVEDLEGVEALWVLNDRSIVMTEGIKVVSYTMGYRQ